MATNIFANCEPRPDVLAGLNAESDFAADLAQVIRGDAPAEYSDPVRFFENTYPTHGLRELLKNVCARLAGSGTKAASIFRLDTQFGGGKTHALIALVHAARSAQTAVNISEFIDPALLPDRRVRVAAFDGENADPLNGRTMGEGIRAFTPWGELAYALAGVDGYERVRQSDEGRAAPGADTLRELFGGEPTLILLDELSVYLRKVRTRGNTGEQLSAFLTSLFKAVETSKNVALVLTLAIGKGSRATDAYSDENEYVATRMAELQSISARMATLLNPTEDHETAHVLRRRLFRRIDTTSIEPVIDAYRTIWRQHADVLGRSASSADTADAFRSSYPFHPDVLDTLTEKVATLSNFQRVRGMLRLLARTVAQLWDQRPGDAFAIHLHHIDPAHEPIRQELITRLSLAQYAPVLKSDVAGDASPKALARQIDDEWYGGLPPYASYVARTVFVHTLAFNDQLRGVSMDGLRFSIIGPGTDISFIEDARKKFAEQSAFLDDRPGVPMRFVAEANLTHVIRRLEQQVEPEEVRAQLDDRIRGIFKRTGDATFDLVAFPGGAYEVPDEAGDSRPILIVLGYDAVAIGNSVDAVPDLVQRIYLHKGADDRSLRINRNVVVQLVADDARISEMRAKVVRRLALQNLKRPELLNELAEHQQAKVRELESRSEQEVALAIQQCYRHVFYPSRADRIVSEVELAHTAIDTPSSSASPGAGQKQVERALRDNRKLRVSGDEPDSPIYLRDRTPLRNGEISVRAFREEFRRDPGLPILVGDDVFIKGIHRGVAQGEYVYVRGEQKYGVGDPTTTIVIDEQSILFTMANAKEREIWPRKSESVPDQDTSDRRTTRDPEPRPAVGLHQASQNESISAEGVLKDALAQLWEKARGRKFVAIRQVTIKVFDVGDAFKILGGLGSLSGVEKTINLGGEYLTSDDSNLKFSFTGNASDAMLVKEFLEPQMRAASEKQMTSEFALDIPGGLQLATDAPEKLADRLTRFASGAAYVSASAELVSRTATQDQT